MEVQYTLDGKSWEVFNDADDMFQKSYWEPGHTEVIVLKVTNKGSLAMKYKASMNIIEEDVGKTKDGSDIRLSDMLTVSTLTVEDAGIDPVFNINIAETTIQKAFEDERAIGWGSPVAFNVGNILEYDQPLYTGGTHYVLVKVDMPDTIGNEANHNGVDVPTIEFFVDVLATQQPSESDSFGKDYDENAGYPWNGTSDVSWYNDDDTEFVLNHPEQLAGLAELVDSGNDFTGKTIKLNSHMDLYSEDERGNPICFEPIGSYRKDTPFKGTFDGNGHTIYNLNQNTWALDNGYYYGDLGLGLFGKVEDATIKNLVMDEANISGESAICGTVAATAYGDCRFENITVSNSNVADYQYYAGGVVGWASGNHKYININVDSSTTIATQWGDFNNSTGGVIGGAGSNATILMKDCTIACRIDVHNDVVSAYQWYSYRNAGMLIGNTNKTATDEAVTTAAAPNLTCENVTVIYGDWANYTYCEFAGTGYPYVRVQSGVSVDAYSNVRYGHPTDANGNTVIDDNHVHNDGEAHHELIVFDQLYGGPTGDRYRTYGTATHDGVTVIYNNK